MLNLHPMKISIKDVLYKIRWFFIPYLVIICACLIIKLSYTREEIYYAVNGHYYAWADFLAPYFTDLGNGWTTVAIAVILVFFSYRKAFIMAVIYALVSGLIAQTVKYIFDAPRPKLYFQKELAHLHFVKGVEILSHHSFPSGHTITAFSTALLITYWCKNKFWGLPLLLVACMVGYSRMYLSEHFFEDVSAGSVIAVISTVLLIIWLDSRQFLQSPNWNRGLLTKR
jgi:membrane-associated phospholipid phosphatase